MDHPLTTAGWESRTDDAGPWVQRFDRGTLGAPHRRADGSLLVEGFACRECVLVYRRADGSLFKELVPLETLKESATGLARLPVTLEHPAEFVTPRTYKRDAVGDTDGEVELGDGGYTKVRLAVRDEEAIRAVDEGKRELSPGYECLVDATPGVHPVHGPYDGVQRRRRYNHLAIVDAARGGPSIQLRADAAVATEAISAPSSSGSPAPSSSTTSGGAVPRGVLVKTGIVQLLSLLGITQRLDSDDAALEAIAGVVRARVDSEAAAERKRQDAATKADADHKAAIDKAHAERDSEKARADKAETELKALKDAEKARADKADRAELETLAKSLQIDPAKHADNAALKLAIASKHLGSEVKADAGEGYIAALVDLAKKGQGKNDGAAFSLEALKGNPNPEEGARQDGAGNGGSQGGATPKRRLSPSEIQRQRADAAFKAARGDA